MSGNFLKIENWKLKITFLAFLVFILLGARNASASTINQPPVTLGLTSGLVGHWTFDGQDMAGERAYDRSGQGNTGLLTSGPTRTLGRIGQALKFNGTSQSVNLGDVLNLQLPIAMSAWVYLTSTPGVVGTIFSTDDNSNFYRGMAFRINSSRALAWQYGDGGSCDVNGRQGATSDTLVPLNKWVHVVMIVRAANDSEIYLNGADAGVNQNGSGGGLSNTTAPARIGLQSTSGSCGDNYYFPGHIDDIRVYNRSLSKAEIIRLYKIGH